MVNKIVCVNFYMECLKRTNYVIDWYVLSGMKQNITIRLKFLIKNHFILNFSDETISVSGLNLEILGFYNQRKGIIKIIS
ncbi:hypothetical protein A0H76_1943 [Hepatospora eriocheir]|uniref:Uncharacterized protein n=1 Tax=Hepatospora eriocheir TaxID=1081669 RepID=A0A1X0QG51_9MICR|nr:hypothetical protein A0H76_1943 [Hepatospora eriocheir]